MADEFKQVTFTHQSADAYAAVELVGDYLFAARIINRKLMPSRDQIGVLAWISTEGNLPNINPPLRG
jgi:hypothetical protein